MAQKILPIVNIDKLYVAKLLTEDADKITYDIPRYLEGIKQLTIKPKQNSDPYYHEGRKILTDKTLEDISVTIDITDLTDEDECYVMGYKMAKTGGVIRNENDIAPTLAILYEAEKSEGGTRYGILYAGTFGVSDEDIKGKEGKANFQSKSIEATFRPLMNGLWNYKVDSDSTGVTQEFLNGFFNQVTIPEEQQTQATV